MTALQTENASKDASRGLLANLRKHLPWIAGWLMVALAGSVLLARAELTSLRESFEMDARIMHRLLSQRTSQHDAVLATLALLQAQNKSEGGEHRLSSVYPQMLAIEKHAPGTPWPDKSDGAALDAAEKASRAASRPALAKGDLKQGHYWMVLASIPNSYALHISAHAMVPWSEWPFDNEGRDSAVRVSLENDAQTWVLQPGRLRASPWEFAFRKHLATASQPFDVVVNRSVNWSELPWLKIAAWLVATALLFAVVATLLHQRRERARAQEWLRLGKVARLNTLGELAAGMAHELNQPLTAVLANTQAATRLLKETPPDTDTAQHAMQRASEQARRASDVLTRLRRTVERPDTQAGRVPLRLNDAVRDTLYLLEPQCREHGVSTEIIASEPVDVMADPVALEQVIHNIATNALQALDQIDRSVRRLRFIVTKTENHGVLHIADNGPGIPADALPRLFEPFFSTRSDGLGLGLSVCESLVNNMDGQISAKNVVPQGAGFTITLPRAKAPGTITQ